MAIDAGRTFAISIHAPRVGSDRVVLPLDEYLPLISIHAPRVGSDRAYVRMDYQVLISIHAPRVGSDVDSGYINWPDYQFQSTLPVWGATCGLGFFLVDEFFYFNPRSPCGERQV